MIHATTELRNRNRAIKVATVAASDLVLRRGRDCRDDDDACAGLAVAIQQNGSVSRWCCSQKGMLVSSCFQIARTRIKRCFLLERLIAKFHSSDGRPFLWKKCKLCEEKLDDPLALNYLAEENLAFRLMHRFGQRYLSNATCTRN